MKGQGTEGSAFVFAPVLPKQSEFFAVTPTAFFTVVQSVACRQQAMTVLQLKVEGQSSLLSSLFSILGTPEGATFVLLLAFFPHDGAEQLILF